MTNSDLPQRHAPNITDILVWALLGIISWNVAMWALLGIISWNVATAVSELRALREDYTNHIIESHSRLSILESQ
jgi:hypothetical protein